MEHASENDKRILRRLAAGFLLNGEILYKKEKDQVFLSCVDASKAQHIVEEIHEGIRETHVNGHKMARQIMRAKYCWLTLENDCNNLCENVINAIYADMIHVSPIELHVMTIPWPFSMWGMDVIGPITLTAFNGHRFIFVIIDYFTKWVKTTLYASITKSVVCKFIKKEIICRYGLPKIIISDNALNLNNKTMEKVCVQFKIQCHNSAPYHPKMNGAMEAASKNLKRIIEKTTDT